ncbi:MAG: long-chain-acyl-CoA synthetase [Rhizobiales bacterium]|nr:long-chain-acyl-CoA synthetase [Hyphomicrobiales bacterium]NRB15658.1 long-chain-acyl-CoA synthetase [Hyphomicrobiales bacterium]
MGLLTSLKNELTYLKGFIGIKKILKPIAANPTTILADRWDIIAKENADKTVFFFEDREVSYRQFIELSNQFTRWALDIGVKKGDSVAVLMHNCPEYISTWVGISRAGGAAALLNTSLTGMGLAHCINIVGCKHIIVDPELASNFESAKEFLDADIKIWAFDQNAPIAKDSDVKLNAAIAQFSGEPLDKSDRPSITIDDPCIYIYTSGTTGLPKAAKITHYRAQSIGRGFAAIMDTQANDRVYITLPLFHSNGGVLAVGAVITVGGQAIIKKRFSASEFWDDCVKYEATIFQYIGELCRFLTHAPHNPNETKHKLRIACGNGLRPDVWEEFQTRFQIPRILEWYGASEGNAPLFNLDNKFGSIGRVPFWAKGLLNLSIVKFDIKSDSEIRGEDGHCIEADVDEVGELISKIINDGSSPTNRFDGYADKNATMKKILHDVYEKGDAWFRTGDLIRKDKKGYHYFVDRIGDTFRWKGENVATSEISETISGFANIAEANVYGVYVPKCDGRACMVALDIDEGFDFDGFLNYCKQNFPSYARPLFIRIQDEIEKTGTFKQRKVDLVEEGFDPAKINDPIYFANPVSGKYEAINAALYEKICKGKFKI